MQRDAGVSGYVAFDCNETFQRHAFPRMGGVNLVKSGRYMDLCEISA
jgi:hypothetical protein